MAMTRIIECDACAAKAVEVKFNEGFKGWGGLHGYVLNGSEMPTLCPDCMGAIGAVLEGITTARQELKGD